MSPCFHLRDDVVALLSHRDETAELGVCRSDFISLSVIDALYHFRLIKSPSSQFEVPMPRNLIRHGPAAIGRFPITSLVTNSPFRGFIHMNA